MSASAWSPPGTDRDGGARKEGPDTGRRFPDPPSVPRAPRGTADAPVRSTAGEGRAQAGPSPPPCERPAAEQRKGKGPLGAAQRNREGRPGPAPRETSGAEASAGTPRLLRRLRLPGGCPVRRSAGAAVASAPRRERAGRSRTAPGPPVAVKEGR